VYDDDLTAKISDIDKTGLVTIEFSADMEPPNDVKAMDTKDLDLALGENSDDEKNKHKKKFDWYVRSFGRRQMKLQI
jgi:hypothetical protein